MAQVQVDEDFITLVADAGLRHEMPQLIANGIREQADFAFVGNAVIAQLGLSPVAREKLKALVGRLPELPRDARRDVGAQLTLRGGARS